MRGTVAKRIRKDARKNAEQTKANVKWYRRALGKTGGDGKPVFEKRGTLYYAGYRRDVKQAKKAYRRNKK